MIPRQPFRIDHYREILMKKRSILKFIGAAVLGVASVVPAGGVLAQGAGGRAMRLVVPLPAGSSNDAVARVLAPYLGNILGQPVVVENKAGGNGLIGTMEIIKSAPDGLNLLLGSNSPLAANVAFVKEMPYDLKRDITPIAGIAQTHWVLLVKPSFPAKSFAEFLAYAKQKQGVSMGYSTTAVQTQIATISKQAGVPLLPVPYKGTPATITDVIGGVLDATLTDPGNAKSQVGGGNLKALAVTSIKRNPQFQDWPAISETLPGFDFRAWNALVGPAGMPRELVNRISNAVAQALKNPDVAEKYATHGSSTLIMSADELRAFIDSETAKWVKLARDANIQPE